MCYNVVWLKCPFSLNKTFMHILMLLDNKCMSIWLDSLDMMRQLHEVIKTQMGNVGYVFRLI